MDRLIVNLDSVGEAWGLDADELESLRWYLEDYLQVPYGVYEDRGPEIHRRLADWGAAAFAALFGAERPAFDAYRAMRDGGGRFELVLRSGSAASLALPWELMHDPVCARPLALEIGGISREVALGAAAAPTEVAGETLRVLMVIARPAGTADVGYQMIARPMLGRLPAVRGDVELSVLRPPTLEALAETLRGAADENRPFQVVHFDGHGGLGPAGEGALHFEGPEGGRRDVSAQAIARLLTEAGVPVVVLNACQSGAIGADLSAAVATRLVADGVASVVAMAYKVYAVAAAEFMAAFYESLFAGEPVSAATRAGRRQMARNNRRPSPKGDLPLDDWIVPVHYCRGDVRFPDARRVRDSPLPLESALDTIARVAEAEGDAALDPVGEFIGRDALLCSLERESRLRKVIVLHGPGGSGKTELAKAFGRWWSQTEGVERPDWVFFHSFEPGTATYDLEGVVTEIGLRVHGLDFARLAAAEQRVAVETFLTEHRALLIWDNFETVYSMTDESVRALVPAEAGRQALATFLARLADAGESTVLITSRTTEGWLPREATRLPVPGLTRLEANQYADSLLRASPEAQAKRGERAFADLMAWLDGHPLSMRLVLPRLADQDSGMLLEELRGLRPPAEESTDPDAGRTASLAAGIAYSFAHLSAPAKALLPAVSLLEGSIDVAVIATFSRTRGVPKRFSKAPAEDWHRVLTEAAQAGLLAQAGHKYFRMHPALPSYLSSVWRADDPLRYPAERESASDALCSTYASYADELDEMIDTDGAGAAYRWIDLRYRTFASVFRRALARGRWGDAHAMFSPLNAYLSARGLYGDADAFARDVRRATQDSAGRPPHLERLAGAIWQLNAQASASRAVERGDLDGAEAELRHILAALTSRHARRRQWWGPRDLFVLIIFRFVRLRRGILADTYHGLGIVLQDKGQLDEADDFFRKSLALIGHAKAEEGNTLHHLGKSASSRGRFDEAEELFRKAIALTEEARNDVGLAATYFELGATVQRQGRLDEAVGWLRKSLDLRRKFNDRAGVATVYYQLGFVALDRGDLAAATDWLTESLLIRQELGDRFGIGDNLQMLGMVAQDRGDLTEAAEWYAKSLAGMEELAVPTSLALLLAKLSSLAEEQGDPERALELAVRSVSFFPDVPDPQTGSAPARMARMTGRLGMPALEQTWRRVTGNEVPSAVRDYVRSMPEHREEKDAL